MAQKRAFKKTTKISGGGAGLFRPWGKWTEGDRIVAKYVSQGIDQYKKPNYHVEILDGELDGEDMEDFIGKTMGLNSTGMLDKAMKKIEEGQMFELTYNGQETLKKGPYAGKESHIVEIDLVEEDDGSEDEEEREDETEDNDFDDFDDED